MTQPIQSRSKLSTWYLALLAHACTALAIWVVLTPSPLAAQLPEPPLNEVPVAAALEHICEDDEDTAPTATPSASSGTSSTPAR